MRAPADIPAIELGGITRRFGAVVATSGVSLRVDPGTVHAVVGENGAGKSTLMKIAYGQIRADAGTISLGGESIPRHLHSPSQAIRRGVGMVHQHFMLVRDLSVVENVVLGREPGSWFKLDLDTPRRELAALAERYGFSIDPDARIEELAVGERQRVEILKVLWQGCKVLILDEPTAVLAPIEVDQLFDILRGLVAGGGTVVLVTHKLDEVARLADRITVMRRGEVVAILDGGTPPREIAIAMVGRPVELDAATARQSSERASAEVVLAVDRLRVVRRDGAVAVDDVSLEVRAGEIVGIAGVIGNGQSELCDAIAGLVAVESGTIAIAGTDVTGATVSARQVAGLAHVPEDRHDRGLVLDMTVAENLVLGRHRQFGSPLRLDRARIDAEARGQIRDADIRPPDPDAVARGLSGGNQQKIVVARELARKPRALVCAQPTRGVDIGAIELIWRKLRAARDAGMGILLVSAELSELRALSDRIAVVHRGKIAAILDAGELASDGAIERIGGLMLGAKEQPA